MNDLESEVYNCLRMFGPCELRTIQQKLDLIKLIKSQVEIEQAAESLVERKLISYAEGFKDIAYKVKG